MNRIDDRKLLGYGETPTIEYEATYCPSCAQTGVTVQHMDWMDDQIQSMVTPWKEETHEELPFDAAHQAARREGMELKVEAGRRAALRHGWGGTQS